MTPLQQTVNGFLAAEGLANTGMAQNYAAVYLPLAQWLYDRRQQGQRLLGVNGAQGSGKSTLCKLLALMLQQGFGETVAVLSLDDFYLTRAQRMQLAQRVHPLLQTRGVPGTHDVELAVSVLTALRNGASVNVPRFDKATDDRAANNLWQRFSQPVDIILFEGWCVGARPQAPAALQHPVNVLEADADQQGIWRQYVNDRLAGAYQTLFALLDNLLMLQVPAFTSVYAWRALQETKLVHGMNSQQLQHFIMHYQRLTEHMLAEMPTRADKCLLVGADHQIIAPPLID